MANIIEFTIKALDGWSAGLDKLNGDLSRTEKAFAALGLTAAAYTIIHMAERSLENAEAMNTASIKAGVATETFSAMAWAAKQSEVDIGSLTAGYKFLNKTLAEGEDGPGSKLLQTLGIATKDTTGSLRDANAVLLDLSDKFKGGALGANSMYVAMTILGRGGSDMVPLLNEGSASIKEMMEQAKKLGQVISTDFGRQADAINDNLHALAVTTSGAVNVAMAELAPLIAEVTGNMLLMATQTDSVQLKGQAMATGFRLIITMAMGTANAFMWLGDNIGWAAAIIDRFAHRDFKGAMEVIKADSPPLFDLTALWTETGKAAALAASAVAKAASEHSKSLAEIQAAAETAIKADIDWSTAQNKLVIGLQDSATQYGMSAGQIKLYTLAMQGADDALIQEAYNVLNATSAMEEHTKVQQTAIDIIKAQRTPLEVHNQEIQDIALAYQQGSMTLGEYTQSIERSAAAWDLAKTATLDYKQTAIETMPVLADLANNALQQMGTIAFQVANNMMQTFAALSQGVGNAVAGAIVDGGSLLVGLQNVLKSVVKEMIATWVSMQLQRAIYAKLGSSTESAAASSHIMASVGRVYAGTYADVAEHLPFGYTYGAVIAEGAAAAASVGALAYVGAGAVAGVAHGGLDYVPKESTYLLDKGERVLSPNQNSDLTSFIQGGGGGGGVVIQNLQIHVLENATNADVFSRMDRIQLRNALGQPVIDALNEMFTLGIRPNFATQSK